MIFLCIGLLIIFLMISCILMNWCISMYFGRKLFLFLFKFLLKLVLVDKIQQCIFFRYFIFCKIYCVCGWRMIMLWFCLIWILNVCSLFIKSWLMLKKNFCIFRLCNVLLSNIRVYLKLCRLGMFQCSIISNLGKVINFLVILCIVGK